MRKRINEATELTCKAGVSCNRMLAKICSDMNKPNNHFILPNDSKEIEDFISNLDVGKIPEIGRISELELNELGIYKCKDILEKAAVIYTIYSERNTFYYIKIALGISRNDHEIKDSSSIQKSISHCETFRNIKEKSQFLEWIERIGSKLAK